MKKNISINISGIIFHIEEDGYEKLKIYLESINKYFSSFEDSGEIIADIESRIAEIFLSKLNEGKQVITAEDVEALVSTMGSIKDFQAVEELESASETSGPSKEKEKSEKTSEQKEYIPPKKLYRDNKRKLLGGVCSGIAHYFSIDPLWVRLLVIILATDIFFSHSLGILVLIAYIVLWIVLPTADHLEEDSQMKKMYRNPEDRVLGGVCSGVAAYFGADATVVRVLFVITFFLGGTGLIAYLILWIILPEARSITDKVQMTGEPVTLENIESNIKKSLKVEETEEESTIVKVLLFPFRLIAMVLTGLGKILGPLLMFLVEAARIILGLILVLTGISFIFALVVTLGVILGLVSGGGDYMTWWDFPYEVIGEAIPPLTVIMAFLASLIPVLVVTLLGLSVIAKTRVVTATVGWTMFGIWLLCLIGLAFTVPKIVYEFRAEGDYEQTLEYPIKARSVHLQLFETGLDDYDFTNLEIKGYEGTNLKLVEQFHARGSSRRAAIENAQMVSYNVEVKDSTLVFDSNFKFEKDSKFRFQELNMTLYIPYGQVFTIDDKMRHILEYYTMSRHGYDYRQLNDNSWVFNPSGLECISCFESQRREKDIERYEEYQRSYEEAFHVNGYYELKEFEDFDNIIISGAFETNIIQGEKFRVMVSGDKYDVGEVKINQDGNLLEITLDRDLIERGSNRNRAKIVIGMPELESLEINGASKAWVRGFDEDRMRLELNGASEANVDMDCYETEIRLSGASRLTLSGTGHELSADLAAASSLDAYEFRVNDAQIDASVASSAKVYVRENLEIDASMASDIKYRGGAKVKRN